jgi:hypothetical protein
LTETGLDVVKLIGWVRNLLRTKKASLVAVFGGEYVY